SSCTAPSWATWFGLIIPNVVYLEMDLRRLEGTVRERYPNASLMDGWAMWMKRKVVSRNMKMITRRMTRYDSLDLCDLTTPMMKDGKMLARYEDFFILKKIDQKRRPKHFGGLDDMDNDEPKDNDDSKTIRRKQTWDQICRR
ncbi:Unknown protein, partial [Striga hermonthica]